MRVELVDWCGQPYIISSKSPKLIGDWFAEHANKLMTGDARCEVRINIWPQDEIEAKTIGHHTQVRFTQDGLLHLAEIILQASQKLAEIEAQQ